MNSTEPSPPAESPGDPVRANLWTVIGIAIVAYAASDMAHEVAGHCLACALTGVRALSLSTVALQTGSSSRLVAAAGSIANVVVGMVALIAFRRAARSGATSYFLWLFASLNLLNGTGYLLFSGLLDVGDWAVVISGLEPHWAWRAVMATVGAALYWGAVRLSAAHAMPLIPNRGMDRGEMRRLVFPAYLAGGLLFVAGSALNPIGPGLILLSGVSSGFGAMAGLLIVPRLVGAHAIAAASPTNAIAPSPGWMTAGVLVAVVFIALLGPGIRLR